MEGATGAEKTKLPPHYYATALCFIFSCIFCCRYLRSAKIGDEIVIDAKTVKLGKSLAFLSVEITNKKDGKIIATGSHTKYISH